MDGSHIFMTKIQGEDLLPKVRQIVKEKGFLPQDAEQRDQSWLDTYGFVQTMLEDFPDYLPNTYDLDIICIQNIKASHLNQDILVPMKLSMVVKNVYLQSVQKSSKEGKTWR